jgi:hypothetical protein
MKEDVMYPRYFWALPLALLLGAGVRHPTPTVVLVKQTDLIRTTLDGAKQFFVRKVTIGRDDLARIRKEVDFSPEDPDLSFYLGKLEDGKLRGVVFFPQVNTVHGPIEVGLTMNPDGTVASAVVTKATVETRPWVEEAVVTGLLKRFQGMRYGDDVKRALGQLSPGQMGQMPYWEGGVITAAVQQGLVLYHMLFHEA